MRTLLLATFLLFCLSARLPLQAQTNDSITPQQLPEVEVSAPIKPVTSLATAPLQVVTAETIMEQGLQSMADVVRRFNGVVLKDYGGVGGLKTISIRGMGAEHTAISYDGIVVSNALAGQVDLGQFALDNISAVSLTISQSDDIFQPARVLASVGTLNLQTAIPQFDKHNYEGKIRITTGSFGLFNPFADYARKLSRKSVLSVNGSWQRTDGNYPFEMMNASTPFKSKRSNSDVSVYRTEANLYNDFGKGGTLNVKIYYFDSERGLPGAVDFQNDYSVERLWNRDFFTQLVYNTTINRRFKFKSEAKYDYNYTRYRDIYNAYEGGKLIDKYKQQEVYWSNALLYTFNPRLSFSLGEDVFYNKLKNEKIQINDNRTEPERYNSLTALSALYKTSRLTVNASLLGTYVAQKIKNSNNNTYKKLSPAIGFSLAPVSSYNRFRIRASYKDIFRIPTFTEAFYTRSLTIIRPEMARQFNGGFTWTGSLPSHRGNYITIAVDGYYNSLKDKIVIRPSTFYAYTTNLGKVKMTGADVKLSAGVDASDNMNIDFSGSYSYMKAIDVTNPTADNYRNQLMYTPVHSGAVAVVFKNPWVNCAYNIVVAGERYYWYQNIPMYRLKGYSEHSLNLNKELPVKQYDVLLQAGISNLWNKQYEVTKSYPMPGRSYNISANLKF
jgi:outer membrane cobalamin receptor